jgi:hypothetical protein
MERIDRKLDPAKALDGQEKMAEVWKARANSSPARQVYEKRLAEVWRETGCAADGAPYVIRGLVTLFEPRWSAPPISAQLEKLATAFLDEENCPGARGLSYNEKIQLKKIRDLPPPPVSKH